MGSPMNSDTTTGGAERNNRRRRFGWKNLSYTARVTLAFALIAAMTALVAIGVVSFVWEQHFQTYTTENIQSLTDRTAERIAAICKTELDKELSDFGIDSSDSSALSHLTAGELNSIIQSAAQGPAEAALSTTGIGLQVVNNQLPEKILYDSSWSFEDSEGTSTNKSLAPREGQRSTSNIVLNGQVVGSVRIWVLGSDTLMRQPDQEFRDNSYQAMLFATVVAIVLASCIGFLFARNLVSPINRMTKTARAIKEGNLSARTGLTGEDEIARLGETFDEMAESVEKDRELERRLTTDVAHELRTPLMAIQSTVEAMVDGVFEADEERLETVNSEVQRLSRLVDALLKLSRLENRANPMKEELVDVGELISGIIATHEAFVSDSGLTLEYAAEKNVQVMGNADMIRQATANLISNAVRYTPEGGRITVRVEKVGDEAAISVRDTGIGLTPEEAKMVFSRFWRADAGRNRESGGLGVGLAVVKEIVDRHGGWVQVEGEKGKGACFTIHIPLYDEARARAKERALKQQQKQQAKQANGRGKGGKGDKSGRLISRERKD